MDELRKVKITNLFGVIPEHVIELKEGGVTFVHGPNGCGKTTCLRLISAVFNWELSVFNEVIFNSIEIETLKGKKLKIVKGILDNKPRLLFSIGKTKSFAVSRDIDFSPAEIEEQMPNLLRTGYKTWLDRNSGMRLEYSEVVEKYLTFCSKKEKPEWLQNFIDSVKIYFIKTQRLLKVDYSLANRHRTEEPTVSDVIQIYSNEIKDLINKKLAEQAAISQSYDRSFPKRLLSGPNNINSLSEEAIRAQYINTEKNIQKLVNAGLMDKQDNIDLPKKKFADTERKVLSLYLDDIEKKLNVFTDLQNKIEIFLEIINTKFKTKKFSIDKEHGFCVHINNSNSTLLPTQLSSGEQHQIVLFYELIFKASDNTFFLIDEPEISLHVDWQRCFLEDIFKIAKLGGRQFLIATHSPQIIGNHRELAVALEDGILHDDT